MASRSQRQTAVSPVRKAYNGEVGNSLLRSTLLRGHWDTQAEGEEWANREANSSRKFATFRVRDLSGKVVYEVIGKH